MTSSRPLRSSTLLQNNFLSIYQTHTGCGGMCLRRITKQLQQRRCTVRSLGEPTQYQYLWSARTDKTVCTMRPSHVHQTLPQTFSNTTLTYNGEVTYCIPAHAFMFAHFTLAYSTSPYDEQYIQSICHCTVNHHHHTFLEITIHQSLFRTCT